MIDREVTAADVQALNDADAVTAIFATLGYQTDARVAQSPANLGLTTEAVTRQIRRLEMLASHDAALLQVYLVEVSSLTLAVVRALAGAFRNRPGNYLLVVTSDYERIDLVLVEKHLPTGEPGTIGQRQVVVRPRILTLERRKPSRVHLRVLRRLTYSESDPIAQYDKLRSAFDVAEWSEEHFNNRALFSDHFLTARLPELPAWDEDPKPAFQALLKLYERAAARFAGKTEAEVRAGLIEPALRILGFEVKSQKRPADGTPGIDYLLRGAAATPLAACLAYTWGRSLDGKDDTRDRETPDENPGAMVVSLLEAGTAPWAMVTNGKHWRLYASAAHSRATNYYEIDIEEVIALEDPADSFRYFWLLFRRDAFAPAEGKPVTSFLDLLLAGSESYARRLGDSLKDRVFEEVFPKLAEGFIARFRKEGAPIDQALLDRVFQGTLTLLYRMLFLLYAESRGLLPVAEAHGYGEASLTQMKREIAEATGEVADEAEKRLAHHYNPDTTALCERLSRLFTVVDRGDTALNVPVYNGGLFLTEPPEGDRSPEAENGRFLSAHAVPDRFLARAVDLLARDIDEKTEALAFIDYKSLGVRQLGSIYEGLLEFRLRVAPEKMAICSGKRTEEIVPYAEALAGKRKILTEGKGKDAHERILTKGTVYLENDRRERKATGSYYTPDFIVKHIVRETVGPVLRLKLDALAPKLRAAQKSLREERKKFEALGRRGDVPEHQALLKYRGLVGDMFDFRLCDPAMGSGHFLVEAVDFITDRLIDFLNGFPWNPVTAQLAETRETILHGMEQQKVTIDPARLTDVNLLKRHVLKRCIYGVDLNPMAVELAKVSLWLDCFTLGAPLSFLDHHLKLGNSLLGASIEGVRAAVEKDLFAGQFAGLLAATETMIHVGELSDVTVDQVRESASAFRDASVILEPFKDVLNLWSSQRHGNPRAGTLMLSGGFPPITKGWKAALGKKAEPVLEAMERLDQEKRFFHWELEFPEVWFERGRRKDRGGFDAVGGNPPWIRQESLSRDKDALEKSFGEVFDSVADTYVFFLARGLGLLSPHGRLGMIVPNKWLRAEYGEKLRRHLVAEAPPLELVDFGHAPIFPDADTFPCIAILERGAPKQETAVAICAVAREEVEAPRADSFDLSSVVATRAHRFPVARLRPEGWDLGNLAVADLLEKIRRAGVPLQKYVGSPPLYGIKTGLNDAFLIDQATRDRLVAEDPKSESVIRKFLRGRDIQRWNSEWGGEWMIVLRSSENYDWPWSDAGSKAESVFARSYPALHKWFQTLEQKLRKREDQGTFWWELRSCDYYARFEQPKIMYQVIAFHSRFALDSDGHLSNDKTFFLHSGDYYLLALLNSPIMWWLICRDFPHMKDEAIAMHAFKVEDLPIPEISRDRKGVVESISRALVGLARQLQDMQRRFVASVEQVVGSVKVSPSIEVFWQLEAEQAAHEVKRCAAKKPPPAALARAVELHGEHVSEARPLLRKLLASEEQLHRLVAEAYGLDDVELHLMGETAPPRDPIAVARALYAGDSERAAPAAPVRVADSSKAGTPRVTRPFSS